MKKEIILLLCFISIMLACSKEGTPNLPEVEPGRFRGSIGQVGYDLVNDKFNKRVSTSYFDDKNIQFQFNSNFSATIIHGRIFDVEQLLTVNLVDPLNTPSFLFFETYKGSKNYTENWITVNWFEQWGDLKTEKFYTTLKDKKSVEAEILSVKYKELKIPSFEVKIRGYLYNTENREDSIFLDGILTSQALY